MSKSKPCPSQYTSPILGGERLTISVKEARKLLGKDFKGLSDDQVQDIIVKLDLIARGFIAQSVPCNL
jgi:hypothetical protein